MIGREGDYGYYGFMKKTSVLVAMSGGVDSSVAAGLLQRQGYEVTGVFMCLGQASRENSHHPGCCSPQDARDAKEVAARLGIRFHVLDFQDELENIIEYFIDEYRRGRTPNPCIECNSCLKFGKLIDYASVGGIDYVATGHYARIRPTEQNNYLCRGVDTDKDQSYALFGMARNNLKRVFLPVGEYSKKQVRELAAEMDLPVHAKQESQEICFVPDDDYARLVLQRAPELAQTGPILDSKGKILGQHEGVFRYTIGQRRGLGVALSEPAYVIHLDAVNNTVVLGSREELQGRKLIANKLNWLVDPVPVDPFAATVQIRYNHRGAPAVVYPRGSEVLVEFDQPVSAITPGQAAVFYDDDIVLGGGWIESGEY